MVDQEERDIQVNVRLSKTEAAKLDAEIKRRQRLDPGLSFSRGEVLRSGFLKSLEVMKEQEKGAA